jgi:hypothetical protein
MARQWLFALVISITSCKVKKNLQATSVDGMLQLNSSAKEVFN